MNIDVKTAGLWVLKMAEVLVIARILPESLEVRIDELEKKIKEEVAPQKVEREPIAFGLTALKISKIIAEKEEEIKRFEERLKSIKGVSQVDILEVSRVFG